VLNQILNIIQKKTDSKTIAKNRLKLMLIRDRTPVEFDILKMIRDDTIDTPSKPYSCEHASS
jgi:septum formation topological specificity factor MinE